MQTQLQLPGEHPSYFNTTRLTGPYLKDTISAAKTQEEQVEKIYRAFPELNYIRDEIVEKLNAECYTSIGRAITVLFNKGVLIKTDIKRTGHLFNKTQYAYQLKR